MSAMMAAIKGRKGGMLGHEGLGHQSQHGDDKEKDLHGFVAGLSEGDKHQLKSILANDATGGKNEQHIAKGGASTEEQSKIEGSMAEENKETGLEEEQEHGISGNQSDDIAKSMLDSRSANITQPRNLSERVKMSLSNKLKGKGKI